MARYSPGGIELPEPRVGRVRAPRQSALIPHPAGEAPTTRERTGIFDAMRPPSSVRVGVLHTRASRKPMVRIPSGPPISLPGSEASDRQDRTLQQRFGVYSGRASSVGGGSDRSTGGAVSSRSDIYHHAQPKSFASHIIGLGTIMLLVGAVIFLYILLSGKGSQQGQGARNFWSSLTNIFVNPMGKIMSSKPMFTAGTEPFASTNPAPPSALGGGSSSTRRTGPHGTVYTRTRPLNARAAASVLAASG